MPTETVRFAETAIDGEFNVRTSVSVPIRVTIKSVKVETTTGCRGRQHPTTVIIDGEKYLDSVMITDCEAFRHEEALTAGPGEVELELHCGGFDRDPDEVVTGEVTVEYSLFVFGPVFRE